MDPTSAVRTDTLPAVATILVPGALASATYIWFSLLALPEVVSYLSAREVLTTIVLVLLWVAAGFIVESAGSYVEVYLIDHQRSDHDKMLDTWWKYLRKSWRVEPVGQRYLRRVLVSFKFELNMFTAAVLAIPGALLLDRHGHLPSQQFLWLLIGLVVGAMLFFFAARSSAVLLSNIRHELTKGPERPRRRKP